MKNCPDCGSRNVAYYEHNAERICKDCGLVLDECGIESNQFIDESVRSRANHPVLSKAGSMQVDGRIVKRAWLLSTREKNMHLAESKIRLIASRLKLTEHVTKEAMVLFKLAVERDLNIGRDNLSIIFGSIYASCLIHGIPKTPLEIVAYTEVSKKEMLKAYLLIKRELSLKITPVSNHDFVPRFCSRLGLSPKTMSITAEILDKIKGKTVTFGKHHETIVASAIYLATKISGEIRPQREIANATGVIEVTIRKRSREISNYLN